MQARSDASSLQLLCLAGLAALLYSSWPLGYFLNPSGNKGLASNLQGIGQPYNWLFITLDVFAGLAVAIVAVWLLKGVIRQTNTYVRNAVIGYGLFGILTSLDAVLPVDCAADQNGCGALINHPLVILHGIVSIASIGFLALSVVFMWLFVVRQRPARRGLLFVVNAMLASLIVFGFITAVLIATQRSSALSQHVFIAICSLWIVLLPYIILRNKLLTTTQQKSRRRLVRAAKTPSDV